MSTNSERKPLAVMADSAFSGLYIIQVDYDIETRLQVVYVDCNRYHRPTWHKVYTDANGNNYIHKFNRRWYIDAFIRLD